MDIRPGHSGDPKADAPDVRRAWLADVARSQPWPYRCPVKLTKVALHQLLQIMLVVAGVTTIIWTLWLANRVTLRAILQPTGRYVIPYATHGGTVFISKIECAGQVLGWMVAAALVAGQLLLNRAEKRSWPTSRSGATSRKAVKPGRGITP